VEEYPLRLKRPTPLRLRCRRRHKASEQNDPHPEIKRFWMYWQHTSRTPQTDSKPSSRQAPFQATPPDSFGLEPNGGVHKPAGQPGEGITYWPPPEIDQNVSHKLGNLGLTDAEENQIVEFLKTLTDGYFVPPVRPEAQPVPSATSPGK